MGLSLTSILLFLDRSALTRLLNLLLSDAHTLLNTEVTLILLLEVALAFLLHNEKLLIEVGVAAVLIDPLERSLK